MALRRPPANGAGVYNKADLSSSALRRHDEPAAMHPAVTLPGLLDAIFWPANAPQWPLGYDELFRSAFAKTTPDSAATVCQQLDRTAAVVRRIRAEVRPTAAQLPLLQKLGQAVGMASGYMDKACQRPLPPQPVARLKMIQSQLQLLTMAIDLVRPPLQQFERSLGPRQKVQFAADGGSGTMACGAAPSPTDWSVDDINQSVQPTDTQRQALTALKLTFASIAGDLHAHCTNPLPPTLLGRLEAIEARLDASWRAALSMRVALGQFESELNDQQRTRLEAMNVTPTYKGVMQ